MLHNVNNILLSDSLEEIASALLENERYICLLHCQTGSMQIVSEESQHLVSSNDMLICHSSLLFGHYMRTPDFTCWVLCVTQDFLRDVVADCFRSEPMWLEKQLYLAKNPVIHLSEFQSELLACYDSLIKVYLRGTQDSYRQQILRTVSAAALLEVVGYLDSAVETSDTLGVKELSQKDLIMQKFLNMLRVPGNTHRDVNWYAEQINITPKYLSAVCKERSGKTASAWIADFFIDEIKRLLVHTDMSVKEVGFTLGFTDTSFFCQYVRKHLGLTPNQLRKKRS